MPPPSSRVSACVLLFALGAALLTWGALGAEPIQGEAVTAPAVHCPCQRPRVDLAAAAAPKSRPAATPTPVSRRERFLGRTAELRDWHRAGRPGDLRADLQAATFAIRMLGKTGVGGQGGTPGESAARHR